MIRYLLLDLVMLGLSCLLAVRNGVRFSFDRKFWLLLLLILLLTAIFDNILTTLPIVTYVQNHILGIHIGTVPIEDFAYAIAAVIIVPALNRNFFDDNK